MTNIKIRGERRRLKEPQKWAPGAVWRWIEIINAARALFYLIGEKCGLEKCE
jgi:hypothetical protein